MSKKSTENHGEGNPKAAARFNHAETAFVTSKRGKDAIAAGTNVKLEDEEALEQAENEGMVREKR